MEMFALLIALAGDAKPLPAVDVTGLAACQAAKRIAQETYRGARVECLPKNDAAVAAMAREEAPRHAGAAAKGLEQVAGILGLDAAKARALQDGLAQENVRQRVKDAVHGDPNQQVSKLCAIVGGLDGAVAMDGPGRDALRSFCADR